MKLIESHEAYRCPIFRVTEDQLSVGTGRAIHGAIRRVVVRHAGSAVVLPVDGDGRVLLVRQYRWPARRALWEACAGRIDEGETPLAAAKRELREETGLRARKWEKLVRFWSSPGFLDEQMHVYAARDLVAGQRPAIEDEDVESRWFGRPELERMIDSGGLPDAKTLTGLLLLWRAGGA